MGIEPEGFDIEELNKQRQKIHYFKYSPVYYKFPVAVPPLRNFNEVEKIKINILSHLYFFKFLPNEKLENPELLGKTPVEGVTYIRFDGINLSKSSNLGKQISTYKNTQVLILTKCDLKSKVISSIELPNLRYSDVSNNNMADLSPLLDCFSKSPNLEVLIIDNNPVCSKPAIRERVRSHIFPY